MAKIFKFLILLFVVVKAAEGGHVIFEDCGSDYELDEVHIAGCERTVPCYLTVGEGTNVTAKFKPSFVSESLNQDAYVILNSVQTDTYIAPTACEATWCPVLLQGMAKYEAKMTLPTNIAMNTRGRLTWQVLNEKGTKVLCFSVVVQTQSIIGKQVREANKENVFAEEVK